MTAPKRKPGQRKDRPGKKTSTIDFPEAMHRAVQQLGEAEDRDFSKQIIRLIREALEHRGIKWDVVAPPAPTSAPVEAGEGKP